MIKGLIIAGLLIVADAAVIFLQGSPNAYPIIPNHYLYSNPYYPPWIPYHQPEAVDVKSLTDIYSVVGNTKNQLTHYDDLPEWRNGDSEMRQGSEFGETTIPNYNFFQVVLKFVKKMRKHFIPLYLTGPDLSSIYGDQKELSEFPIVFDA